MPCSPLCVSFPFGWGQATHILQQTFREITLMVILMTANDMLKKGFEWLHLMFKLPSHRNNAAIGGNAEQYPYNRLQ